MKHSFVPDTRQEYKGHCTSSKSNECDGYDNPSYSQCSARYICTTPLIPTERNTRAAGNKRYLCKSASCILYGCHPNTKPSKRGFLICRYKLDLFFCTGKQCSLATAQKIQCNHLRVYVQVGCGHFAIKLIRKL